MLGDAFGTISVKFHTLCLVDTYSFFCTHAFMSKNMNKKNIKIFASIIFFFHDACTCVAALNLFFLSTKKKCK